MPYRDLGTDFGPSGPSGARRLRRFDIRKVVEIHRQVGARAGVNNTDHNL